MKKNIDIGQLFRGLQNQMIGQLSTNRKFITHPGSIGDSLENSWIEWLRIYLPHRYSVDKAIVIDHKGNTSHQIDVVIYDNWYTPFIFSQNGFHYIPAEGVYAVFEVKPEINKGNIKYAAEKIESVRVLERTSTGMINSGRHCNPRPLTKILGGILCSTNNIKKDNLIKHLKSLKGFQSIDLGCIADGGSFVVDFNGKEDDKETENFNKRYQDYYLNRIPNDIIFSKPENSLVTFFMQLIRYLQQAIGTVPAIDLQKYLDKIDESIDEVI